MLTRGSTLRPTWCNVFCIQYSPSPAFSCVQPPDPDWGSMVSEGRTWMLLSPWTALVGGLAIMVAVVAFNLVGDGLRAQLDPRQRDVA